MTSPRHRRHHQFRWYLLVGLACLTLIGADPQAKSNPVGDPPGVQLANEFAQALEEKTRLAAETAFLQSEAALLSHDRDRNGTPRPLPLLDSLQELQLLPEIQKHVLTLLEENTEPLNDQIGKLADDSTARLKPLREAVVETRSELNSSHLSLFEATVQRQFTGQIASLINVDNRWLWLCGVLAVGTLLLVRVHHYRHYYRRLLWVRRRRAAFVVSGLIGCLCLVLIPTILTFVLGNKTYESLINLTQAGGSPTMRLEKELADLQAEISQLQQQRDSRRTERDAGLAKRRSRVTAVLDRGTGKTVPVQELSESIRDQLRTLAVNSKVEFAFAAELARELPQLNTLAKERKGHEADIQRYRWFKRMTGAGLGIFLLVCTLWNGWTLERRIARERKTLARTCPRCLAVDKLQPNPNQQFPGGIVATEIRELVCSHVIQEDPYEECGFTFLEQHRDHPRLTFPTLGVPSSGKTVGMLMTYHQLRNGMSYGSGSFEKLSIAGSQKFDEEVDDLIRRGIVPSRTSVLTLPPPMVFNFCDSDPLGKSNALVNIFDYAGMMTTQQSLNHVHRFRALNADGYFFYIDPTYPSQEQSDALNRFREDIKTLRRLGPNQKVHTPVALCLSKIDLMVNQPYGRGDTILEFYEDLRKIEQTTESGSLERVVKRSELTARLRHLIWPDWEIETQIRGVFGDQFLFFPMTPIGMDQPGEENLSQRDLRPYCILEPLSWLLHMNGYPILKE